VIETSETRRFLAHLVVDLSNEQPRLPGKSKVGGTKSSAIKIAPSDGNKENFLVKENIAAT